MIRLPQDLGEAVKRGETVVVPSRQRAESARLAYAAAALAEGRRSWNTPDILPLEAWFSREIERRVSAGERLPRLLTSAESWLLWRQAASQLTEGLDLVARAPLADALSRASQLAAEYNIDVERLRAAPGTETRLLADAQRFVNDAARALGAASVARLVASAECAGDEKPVVVAGFGRLTPRLQALIERRRARGFETRVREPMPLAENRARVVHASDPTDELERIAEWCSARLAKQPDARLLVVLAGSPAARERLITLIRQTMNPYAALNAHGEGVGALAAIEGGEPLARAPLVAHALTALSWLTRGGELNVWSEWLRSPYWAAPDFAARSRIDLFVRERVPLDLDLPQLSALLAKATGPVAAAGRELLAQLGAAAVALDVPSASPRQWSERFRTALAALRWPGLRTLSSDEQQTTMRFGELLDEFGELEAHLRSISRFDAVRWLTELATRIAFRPATGDPLITVSSQLTDPIVRFDGIWVAGLHADAWPAPPQPDPFLPLATQLEAGIPRASAAGQTEEARYLLNAWRAATEELVLSVPARVDDVQVAPSPLLRDWPSEEGVGERTSIWLPMRVRREGLVEMLDDYAGLPWPTTFPLPSGTQSVELQNKCPFRAYAELRLGCTDVRAAEPGVPPDRRGRLLHAALERLWRKLQSSRALSEMSPEALDELIVACVRDAAERVLGLTGDVIPRPVDERECRRAERLIRQLCEVERKRSPFHVRETESERTLEIAGATMKIRIDRIDEVPGGLAILDYKSGRAIPGDWYGERPSHPQLLAYLAAVGDSAIAMATVGVTAREVRFDGIAASGDVLPRVRPVLSPSGASSADAWRERQHEWRAVVERLVRDFVDGRAVVDPMPNACNFCRVVSVCRIAERNDYAVEALTDE
ncbi:MAG TPA: PD-(D/E)XK nuclease family protein [Steroidobacteraceae bacterium]